MASKIPVSATYKNLLIGRKEELSVIKECCNRSESQFITIYGRRRIGKTYLIRHAFQKENLFIEVTGTRNEPNEVQISNFLHGFSNTSKIPLESLKADNWSETLELFTNWLEKKRARVVLFLDELPWLVGKRSNLLDLIDYYWNTRWSKRENFILVICGSASSWIIEKILHDTGGLYNRVTRRIHIRPFNIKDTSQYLTKLKMNFSPQQVIELYLVFGGVPFYLNLLPSGASPAECVDRLIYQDIGQLHDEYELLMQALFRNPELHEKILGILCRHRYGLRREEIAKLTKSSDGGGLTRVLQELENCDFIKGYVPFGKTVQGEYFRVVDEFTIFYNRWLARLKKQTLKIPNGFWLKQQNKPAFNAFCGYNFESLVQKHLDSVLDGLGISGLEVEASTWSFRGDAETQGAQIDLVLNRADKVINLCEIKYNQTELSLSRKDAEYYLRRAEVFKQVTKTKKTVRSVLISFSGVKENEFLHRCFSNWLDFRVFGG